MNKKVFDEEDGLEPDEPVVPKRLYLKLLVPMKVTIKGIGTIMPNGDVLNRDGDVVDNEKFVIGPVTAEIADSFRGAAVWKVLER